MGYARGGYKPYNETTSELVISRDTVFNENNLKYWRKEQENVNLPKLENQVKYLENRN